MIFYLFVKGVLKIQTICWLMLLLAMTLLMMVGFFYISVGFSLYESHWHYISMRIWSKLESRLPFYFQSFPFPLCVFAIFNSTSNIYVIELSAKINLTSYSMERFEKCKILFWIFLFFLVCYWLSNWELEECWNSATELFIMRKRQFMWIYWSSSPRLASCCDLILIWIFFWQTTDWEVVADRSSNDLLSSECLPGISKVSLEDTKSQPPKRRGRGTFSYQKHELYSDHLSESEKSSIANIDNEDACHSSEGSKEIRNCKSLPQFKSYSQFS